MSLGEEESEPCRVGACYVLCSTLQCQAPVLGYNPILVIYFLDVKRGSFKDFCNLYLFTRFLWWVRLYCQLLGWHLQFPFPGAWQLIVVTQYLRRWPSSYPAWWAWAWCWTWSSCGPKRCPPSGSPRTARPLSPSVSLSGSSWESSAPHLYPYFLNCMDWHWTVDK